MSARAARLTLTPDARGPAGALGVTGAVEEDGAATSTERDALEQRLFQVETLYEIGRECARVGSIQEVLHIILSMVMGAFGSTSGLALLGRASTVDTADTPPADTQPVHTPPAAAPTSTPATSPSSRTLGVYARGLASSGPFSAPALLPPSLKRAARIAQRARRGSWLGWRCSNRPVWRRAFRSSLMTARLG